jgi:hypothetical protein
VRRAPLVSALKLFAAVGLLYLPSTPIHAQANLEIAIKATYLYKFAPFIDWPPAAFPASTSPLVICIAGDDPFGATLDRAVVGHDAGPRPVDIRRDVPTSEPHGCHILYLGSNAGELPEGAAAQGVLTVTDGVRGPTAKGIVHFVLSANRIRFEIDERAASERGLSISSKLLSLAVSVRPRVQP